MKKPRKMQEILFPEMEKHNMIRREVKAAALDESQGCKEIWGTFTKSLIMDKSFIISEPVCIS